MSHFKKIGIYAKNRTSSVISAIKKLEKSLESFGCNIFLKKHLDYNLESKEIHS